MYVHVCIFLSICLYIYIQLCTYLFNSLSIYLSINFLTIYLSIYLSVCLSIYPFSCLSIFPLVCLFNYQSTSQSVYLTVCTWEDYWSNYKVGLRAESRSGSVDGKLLLDLQIPNSSNMA